jgi:hypothetical protein
VQHCRKVVEILKMGEHPVPQRPGVDTSHLGVALGVRASELGHRTMFMREPYADWSVHRVPQELHVRSSL